MRTGEPPPAGALDPAERMSRDELAALQAERLRWTLRHAYENVPFYRERFDRHGVHPDDCREPADLSAFPFTTKDDLRAGYPFGLLAVPRERLARVHASSGTTGQPTIVGHTREDVSTWADLMARTIRAGGGRPGDLVHVAYGYGLFTGGLGAHYGAERLGCAVVPASGGMTSRQLRLIADLRPDVVMVTPSYMLALLDAFDAAGLDARACSPRVGLFGAEPWTEEMRQEIEERSGLHAVDIYGLSEVMGPGVAGECVESKDGPHLWEDHFYPEIVDPFTGEPAPAGELVLTTLTRQAQPMIRYRTRDLTRLLPGTARPAFRRMERVTGRTDDMIIVRGVNVFPTRIEELVLRTPGLSPHFQLHLTRPGRLDVMTVRVEARPGAGGPREAAGAALAQAVREAVGVGVEVEVVDPGTLERSVGKLRRVVDRRGQAR